MSELVNTLSSPAASSVGDHVPKVGEITRNTTDTGISPTAGRKNSPTEQLTKTPSYYYQGSGRGVSVVTIQELSRLLRKHELEEWCTRVRLEGLQLLLCHCVGRGKKAFCISAALAEQYVSEIKRAKSPHTISSPLLVLCKIGLLVRTHPGVRGWHTKVSARYRIHPEYAANRQCFQLSDAQKRKLARAGLRRERRLDAGHPERKGILESLAKLSFAETARSRIAELWGKNEQAAKRVVHAIDCRKYFISFDTVGQITTPISSLPRDLKDHLLIEGEEAVFVDVSNAHYCFLPRLLKDRIDYHRGNARWVIGFTSATSLGVLFVRWDAKPDAIAHMELERIRLVDDLSMGDFYASLGGEGKARDSVKKLANTVLNMQNEKATKIPFYQSLRRRFPASFGVLEDIKRKDHRNASTPFRHYTAESMKLALLELQAHNITAIPQTDALLCRRRDVECASRALGAAVFKVSGGVRCKAGGIRFEPQPQACIQGIEKEPHCSELIAA